MLWDFQTAGKPDIVNGVRRLLPRIGAFALALFVWVGSVIAEPAGLQLPVEKKLPAGESTVEYAGQVLRFTSSVPLHVRLEPLSQTLIRFRVRVQPGHALPTGPAGSSTNNLEIYWVNVGTDVYQGGAPTADTIEGTLNTEGGFVDR